MKKLITIAILAIFLIGCTEETIKIGVMAPMSGNAAELGQHIQRGLELANIDGKYELIFEDTKCFDTKAAISGAQKLINIDKVDYVIGPLCAPAYQATTGIFNNEEVAFMHTSGVTPPFIENSGKFGIPGISTTIYQEDKALTDFIESQGIQKMAVLVWNEEWAIEHKKGFTQSFDGEIVFEDTFEITETDFRTTALKLKESGAEGVFVVALNFQMADIVKQFEDIQIFGQFEIEDSAFVQPAGNSAEGVVYVYPKIENTKEVREFVQAYKTKYGSLPNYYAYIGFDSLKLYDFAMNQCSSTQCVVETILSTQNFQGVSGKMSFQDKKISREFEIKTVRNGEFVSY